MTWLDRPMPQSEAPAEFTRRPEEDFPIPTAQTDARKERG